MNIFNQIQVRRPKKNKFNLSHERKHTMNMGDLVPCLLEEVLPGDSWKLTSEILLRMSPLQSPIFQRVKNYTHFFFVPSRLLWDEFRDFITGGVTGTLQPTPPTLWISPTNKTAFAEGSLADYFGLPTIDAAITVTNWQAVSAMPFRAYQLIYNEYFRDQTLTPPIVIQKTGGDIGSAGTAEFDAITKMQKRSWQKDYFTSCLPQAQRGGSVLLPTDITYKTPALGKLSSGQFPTPGQALNIPGAVGEINAGTSPIQIENIESLGTTINDLRVAARLQEWLEKNARGGARYVEQLLQHWGVISSDARQQRPEYLGGGNNPIVISEILSTFQEADDTGYPQGNMSGHGLGVSSNHGFRRTFEEHGYIIGLQSVLPAIGYQQGIHKMWQRTDKLHYAWPEFGQLGEQEVIDNELYYDPTAADGSGSTAFGYQSRYAEYKYKPNTVHGEFRSTRAYWHQNRIFASKPSLNAAFVASDPSDRIFAVQNVGHKLLVNMYHNMHVVRALPYYGTPTL